MNATQFDKGIAIYNLDTASKKLKIRVAPWFIKNGIIKSLFLKYCKTSIVIFISQHRLGFYCVF